MGWRCQWRVKCERCGALGPAQDVSEEAEGAALAKGWLRGQAWGMALHLCPDCVNLGLPPWWPDATGLRFHWEEEATL